MPMISHCLRHDWQMMRCFRWSRVFPFPHFFHHSGTSWSYFLLSKESCSRTGQFCFFRCFLGKSKLAFLLFSVTGNVHPVIKPLYLDSRCHTIVNFDKDKPTSSRAFLILVDVMEGCISFLIFVDPVTLKVSAVFCFYFSLWCLLHLHWHTKSSRIKLPNSNLTFGINSECLIDLICHEITRATHGSHSLIACRMH